LLQAGVILFHIIKNDKEDTRIS